MSVDSIRVKVTERQTSGTCFPRKPDRCAQDCVQYQKSCGKHRRWIVRDLVLASAKTQTKRSAWYYSFSSAVQRELDALELCPGDELEFRVRRSRDDL